MRKLLAPFVLAFALIAAPSSAETITSSAAKIQFDAPDNWKQKKDGDAITIMDKQEDVAIAFIIVDAGAVDKATEALDKQLKKTVKKLKWEKEKDVTINGLEGVSIEGDGQIDGKDVDILVLVLDTPATDKDLIVLAIGEDAKLDKHEAEVKGVFKSIKPKKK